QVDEGDDRRTAVERCEGDGLPVLVAEGERRGGTPTGRPGRGDLGRTVRAVGDERPGDEVGGPERSEERGTADDPPEPSGGMGPALGEDGRVRRHGGGAGRHE